MIALFIFALIGWAFAILAGLGYWQMHKDHNEVLKLMSRLNALYERMRKERDDLEKRNELYEQATLNLQRELKDISTENTNLIARVAGLEEALEQAKPKPRTKIEQEVDSEQTHP